MKTILTRFGEVEYDPAQTIHFPEGLIGLEQLKDFLVMPNQKEGPLFWIQNINDPDFAFVVTDPTGFFPDYVVLPDAHDREKLGITEDTPCFVLSIVTISPTSKDITFNLSGPILYTPKTRRGLQVVLDDSRYDTRVPLPQINKPV